MNPSKQLMDELNRRISEGNNKKIGFSLLYQITDDKADVDQFHTKCDAKGPTVTILHGKFNTLFGGYTSKSWRSTEKQKVKDENAFLFKKNDSLDAECFFFPIKRDKTENAIICDKNFGPTFGVGILNRYDLQTFKRGSKKVSKKKGQFLKLNGSLNRRFSYYVDDSDDINSGKMLVSKLEVYQVTEDELGKDWLEKIEHNAFENKKRELIHMVPLSGLDIGQYNVLLLGAVGAGKSSFINTLSALVTGRIEPIAQSRQSASSVTNQLKKYDLRSANGDTLKIRFFDMRGFDQQRATDKELELLIDGRLPDNYQFSDKFDPDAVIEERPDPTLNDKMHLICYVEENSDFEKYDDVHKNQVNRIHRIISNKGLPMIVIATKFDRLCPTISKNVGHLFRSPKAKNAVADIAKFHGVNIDQVFPVVNNIHEEDRLEAKDQLALKALYRIYKSLEGYLAYHPDRKLDPDSWKAREDGLPDWNDDAEKRNLLGEKLTPFDDLNLRILLVGPVDSGKSSFIDSVYSALCGKIVVDASHIYARAMTDNLLSTTEKFKLFPVVYLDRDTGAKRMSGIRLGDTPGFQEQDGIKEDHVKFIISGNVPDGYKIINGIQDTQEDFQRDPSLGDKIHCVCFVFDCEKVQKGLPESIKTSISNLRRIIVEKACPHIVLLTKCDKVSNSLKTSTKRIFEDGTVRECKERLKTELGFRQQQIYPIVNYFDQNDVDKQTDRLILAAFFEILDLGKTHMESAEGQEEE